MNSKRNERLNPRQGNTQRPQTPGQDPPTDHTHSSTGTLANEQGPLRSGATKVQLVLFIAAWTTSCIALTFFFIVNDWIVTISSEPSITIHPGIDMYGIGIIPAVLIAFLPYKDGKNEAWVAINRVLRSARLACLFYVGWWAGSYLGTTLEHDVSTAGPLIAWIAPLLLQIGAYALIIHGLNKLIAGVEKAKPTVRDLVDWADGLRH